MSEEIESIEHEVEHESAADEVAEELAHEQASDNGMAEPAVEAVPVEPSNRTGTSSIPIQALSKRWPTP